MASESGRINEFADDAHFWPQDPVVEEPLVWMASQSKNDRVRAVPLSELKLFITDFNGRQIQIPVKIRKEND